MALRMARCIGRSGCDGEPGARGLCRTCYQRHMYNDNLDAFPTMQERTQLAKSERPVIAKRRKHDYGYYSQNRRDRFYAQRVVLNGYTVHPTGPHGTLNGYTSYGCRGPLCRSAQRWYRETGEGVHPMAHVRPQTVEDCVAYPEWGTYK